jgi:hypothetical protein
MGGSQWETERVFEGAVMGVKARACRGSIGKRVNMRTAMRVKASVLEERNGRGSECVQGLRRARKRVDWRTVGVQASEY